MATATTAKTHCVKCQKQKSTVKCGGCIKDFCLTHMNEHHQELSAQLAQTEDQYNQFKSTLDDQDVVLHKHPWIQQIGQWEQQSIERIRHVANEVRLQASTCIKDSIANVNLRLERLTEKLVQCRGEDDFADTEVQLFDEGLQQLIATLDAPSQYKLECVSTSFIIQIYLIGRGELDFSFKLRDREVVVVNDLTFIFIRRVPCGGRRKANILDFERCAQRPFEIVSLTTT